MDEKLITKILAEEIKDSRGNPTIKVSVWVDDMVASFSVPSGASTGSHEAHELRDEDNIGVKTAIDKVNTVIAPKLIGQNIFGQGKIDRMMIDLDGTYNKDNLGGNSMIGVSIACAKVAAKVKGIETFEYLQTLIKIKPSRNVPYLFMNLLEGGKHASNGLAFQEYHIVPQVEDIKAAVDIGIKVDNTLGEMIEKLSEKKVVYGDEGGFAPPTEKVRVPLQYLQEAINQNNLQDKVRLALDVASSSFFKNGLYKVDGKNILKEELANIYDSLVKEFNLFSVEDPFDEEDFESFKLFKNSHHGLIVVGDDLTVSNQILLRKALQNDSINAMIIKPNQIGTLTETLETMKIARNNDIELIVSHRGRETDDDFIADLAFAFKCFGLKAGAPTKPERMVKYNRLIKITNY